MADTRVQKLANVLLQYSLELKRGHLFKIQGEAVTLPLMKACYEEAVKLGAHPYLQVNIPQNEEALLKFGSDTQLSFIPPTAPLEARKVDALLVIWGTENTRNLSGVDPKRQAIHRKSRTKLLGVMLERMAKGTLRWVGTQFPTAADAQDADMSLSAYEDFVYGAGHILSAEPIRHWRKMQQEQDRLIKQLSSVDRLRFRADGTDLSLRVKGRRWINCCGKENFPDGEIFTGPLENSAEGTIRYSFPAVYHGREVQDVQLQFRKGKVVKATAAKNEEFLTAMLDMDKGARYLGEVAIGTNYEIRQFSRNTLFDEKIGGTCHLAVGTGFPETGSRNKSALHWDMVCDLRDGGEIEADGKSIYRNGKFLI